VPGAVTGWTPWVVLSWTCTVSRSAPSTRTLTAFSARSAAEGAAQRLQEPLAARFAYAVQAAELPAHLDAEHEAARLRLLLDGLRLQLVTTPQHTSAKWALAVLDDHLAALAASSSVN
jgi:hypothetical protein